MIMENLNTPQSAELRLTDTHCHPFDEAFDEDRTEVLERARQAGVIRILCPAIDSTTHGKLLSLCEAHPELCTPMMGLHPTSVNDNPHWREELSVVERFINEDAEKRFCAIGEIGLDLYWSRDWQKEQEEALVFQIELALKHNLPVAIHTRNAWSEMIALLSRFRGRGLRGVMHAFNGTRQEYDAINVCGEFMYGIGGVITYKKSGLSETVAGLPLEKLVLETDSPYLTPVPFRGKRNEPSYIRYICSAVAAAKGVSEKQVADITTRNANNLFGTGED